MHMLDTHKYKHRSINLSRKGYAPQPTKEWLDNWEHRYHPYAFRLLYFLLDLTPYKDSDDWKRGVLEISMRDVAKELGWSHNTVDKTMDLLYNDGIISWVSNNGRFNNTTITFCNYDELFNFNVSSRDTLDDVNVSPRGPLDDVNVSPRDTQYRLPLSQSSKPTRGGGGVPPSPEAALRAWVDTKLARYEEVFRSSDQVLAYPEVLDIKEHLGDLTIFDDFTSQRNLCLEIIHSYNY